MQPPTSRTLYDLLRENSSIYPEGIAITTLERQVTFAELAQRARTLAGAIRAYGIMPNERIGILTGNTVEWLEILFAGAAIGATVVPFSTWSTAKELDFLIADSNIKLLFSAVELGSRRVIDELPSLASTQDLAVIAIGGADADGSYTAYERFFNSAGYSDKSGFAVNASSDAVILYTSGSTSHPKGVRLAHHGIVENGFHIGERQGLQAGESVFLPTPLFWSYGVVNALPAAFTHCAGLALIERFEPKRALDLIEHAKCASVYTLPSISAALMACETFSPERTASLRTGMTIGAPHDFVRTVEGLQIPELCNVYGATENYGNCAVADHAWSVDRRARSQGEPLPGVRLRIRDPDTGHELPSGSTGLVEIRGYITPGYIGKSAELNEKVFTEDGFYRSGDLGYIDDLGGFVFVGRNTDMIKRNGINVSPAEIEDVLLGIDGIASAAVVGAPRADIDEAIMAFVVHKSSGGPSVDDIVSHCRKVMSKYKIPDHIEICDELPLTGTGKLQRNHLKERAAELAHLDEQAVSR